jgi:S-adenosylmethionine:tRNA ribosyltransferase-isomerase
MTALELDLAEPLAAHEPPEARGTARDDVRLLVATRHDGRIEHTRFGELPRILEPGDLVVVNNSATLPAALPATRADGSMLELHLSTPAPDREDDRWWIVELRRGARPFGGLATGERLTLPGRGSVEIAAPFARGRRLWLAKLEVPGPLLPYLTMHGRPIRYSYVPRPWPLDAYQNVFALEPGSAEMPSAGRPFSAEVIARLVGSGIVIAPVTLHAGVSSSERGERPYAERYRVPVETARIVNAVRSWGGRVIAVGTTVVRALETVGRRDGTVAPGSGWTELVVTPERGLRVVDGLVSGWHEPTASHIDLLRAAAGGDLLDRSYRAAIAEGYLWHEFGDAHLVLP